MHGDEIVVADTSPLLNLALIDELELVAQRWETVTIPDAVWRELVAGEDGLDALRSRRRRGDIQVVDTSHTELFVQLRHELDEGEAAAITLALDVDADLVLLDEREARTVARRHDLQITGAIGVLLWGVREQNVDIETALDSLRSAGFWIGDELYERALREAEMMSED